MTGDGHGRLSGITPDSVDAAARLAMGFGAAVGLYDRTGGRLSAGPAFWALWYCTRPIMRVATRIELSIARYA